MSDPYQEWVWSPEHQDHYIYIKHDGKPLILQNMTGNSLNFIRKICRRVVVKEVGLLISPFYFLFSFGAEMCHFFFRHDFRKRMESLITTYRRRDSGHENVAPQLQSELREGPEAACVTPRSLESDPSGIGLHSISISKPTKKCTQSSQRIQSSEIPTVETMIL